MRVWIATLVSITLSACATFDNNEYARLVDMRHELQEARCADDAAAQKMVWTVKDHVRWLEIYSRYLPWNEKTLNMLAAYSQGVQEFDEMYQKSNPSVIFCQLKVRNLHDQLDIMLATTARRPR